MVITEYLERNARLYGSESALVEINPSEERDNAVTWRDFNLIENANPDAPYRREMSWKDFDRRANRFANLLLSRGLQKGTKVAILLMNCLEWLPIYFGILKAGCIAVPMNFRYSSDEIQYCLDLADVEVLVFGPEFVTRMDAIVPNLGFLKMMFFVGRNCPEYAEDCMKLTNFCSSSAPPVALTEDDHAAIYFSSGTTGFPKAILHDHRSLTCACMVEQNHHGQTREDVFLCIPPLYHTGAKMHWFGSLLSGSKAVLLRGVKPEWILRAVTEEKCTIVWLLVPWAQDLLDAVDAGRINLDDYYLDRDQIAPGPDGKLDLEHINTIDVDLFRKDMAALLQGKEVELPIDEDLYYEELMKRVQTSRRKDKKAVFVNDRGSYGFGSH